MTTTHKRRSGVTAADVVRERMKKRFDDSDTKRIKPNNTPAIKLVEKLIKSGNHKFGDNTVRMIDQAESNTRTYISTGVPPLDVMLSGKVGRGLSSGRAVEIFGQESIGKTTLGCSLMRSVQAMGGVAVMVDAESTLDKRRVVKLGIDPKALVYDEEYLIADILNHLMHYINQIKRTKPAVIFWDSLAGSEPRANRGREVGEGKAFAAAATEMSDGFRKIAKKLAASNVLLVVCNQLKDGAIGNGFAAERDRDGTYGGKALRFHSYVRLRLRFSRKHIEQIKGKHRLVGTEVLANTAKHKEGPCDVNARLLIRKGFFDPALCSLLTLIEWEAVPKGKDSFAFNGKRYSEELWRERYANNQVFQNSVHAALEETFATRYGGFEEI